MNTLSKMCTYICDLYISYTPVKVLEMAILLTLQKIHLNGKKMNLLKTLLGACPYLRRSQPCHLTDSHC
jgi:hypothetical protein